MKTRLYHLRVFGIGITSIISILIIINTLKIQSVSVILTTPLEARFKNFTNSNDLLLWSQERETLLREISDLKQLEKENSNLRELLGFTKKVEYDFLIANVLARDPINPGLFYIDRGSGDGLSKGLPVINTGGIIIGKISKTSFQRSAVEMLVDNSSRIAVKALNEDTTGGILKGYLSAEMKMEYVLDSKTLQQGTLIVTSGLEPQIPAGLLVGTVSQVDAVTETLFTTATIEPATNLNDISIITVLKNI